MLQGALEVLPGARVGREMDPRQPAAVADSAVAAWLDARRAPPAPEVGPELEGAGQSAGDRLLRALEGQLDQISTDLVRGPPLRDLARAGVRVRAVLLWAGGGAGRRGERKGRGAGDGCWGPLRRGAPSSTGQTRGQRREQRGRAGGPGGAARAQRHRRAGG